MPYFSAGVEQALHYLVRLVDNGASGAAAPSLRPSARDLADFYNQPASVAAKLFTQLEKAGIVTASEGREGGFVLARPLSEITVLQVVEAIDGRKRLFHCREIRGDCAIFNGGAPDWSTRGVCAIHAVMIDAEQALRKRLDGVTLAAIADRAGETIPADFQQRGGEWFEARRKQRRMRKPKG